MTGSTLMSVRARDLASGLRGLAGNVAPATWQALRPLANEAEAMAEELERSESFEATVIQAAGEEVARGNSAERAAG